MSSSGPPKLARRERALEAARRRLKRLEIETHRVKAALSRLEADYEDDLADWLSRTLGCPANQSNDRAEVLSIESPGVGASFADSSSVDAPNISIQELAEPRELPPTRSSKLKQKSPRPPLVRKRNAQSSRPQAATMLPPQIKPELTGALPPASTKRLGRGNRRSSPRRPLMVSFGVHAAALLVCTWLTFATLVNRGIPLFASPALSDELPEKLGEVEITSHKFADDELQNVAVDDAAFNVSDNLLRQFDPAQIGAGSESFSDMGQLDAPLGDLGKLMAGAGEPGSGKNSGPQGSAVFFGAQSRGNRFVYVVDNSSSMS